MEFPFNIYSLKEGDTHTISTQPQGCLRHRMEHSPPTKMYQVLGWATSQRHTWNWKITCKTKKKELVLLRLHNRKNRLEFYKKWNRQTYISSIANVWRVEENYHSLNVVPLLILKDTCKKTGQ
jgi:hypothetical protein